MNYVETLNQGSKALETSSNSPALDAEVLLRFVVNLSKEDLISNRLSTIDPKKHEKYLELLKERKKGVPVAYLTGQKEFYRAKFKVNKHVLIPRPETESLVERIIYELGGKHSLKILDIGTGSGCIIISLARNLSNANHYFGSDDSTRALAVAEENAVAHKVKIKFIRSDLTKNTGTDYDVIVANLPYLSVLEDDSTKFEPKTALLAENNGLALYERLFKELSVSKHRPMIYLEFGHDHAEEIKRLVEQYLPGSMVEIFRDLMGVPRFARIWRKQKPGE
ncbi:MAG TPA: peptide chain release factor N(5)-glutamine methyltransferase [Candidatus Binatia bacterium]|nr:peptide chain release factor N(5)-glutamine methyltransferase [Candidatus Binatia bacterium]